MQEKFKQTDFVHYTPVQLKNLLTLAQQYDNKAIAALCKAFKPLIIKEAHTEYVYAFLGDDCENIAWEIFLNFLYQYQGNKYHLLPGLIRKHIHFGLLHAIEKERLINQKEEELDLSLGVKDICQAMDIIALKAALNQLTCKQKEVIQAVFFAGYSLDEYRKLKKISFKTAYLHQQKALDKLKTILRP